jgi:RNA polymerase sigma-70 factor (ECF subfamily)
VLGCPEGTVAWRVHEARKKLKAYLVQRGFVPAGEEGAA